VGRTSTAVEAVGEDPAALSEVVVGKDPTAVSEAVEELARGMNPMTVGEAIGDSPAWTQWRSGRTRWLWRHGGGAGGRGA
jgi:hypothetical protein